VLGKSVASAGDINGDGFDDIILSATGYSLLYSNFKGVYVVFGKAGEFGTVDASGQAVVDLFTLSPADGFIIPGGSDQGVNVASAGDINGDGFDDIVVGYNSGESYAMFGKNGGFGTVDSYGRSVIDVTTLAAADGFVIKGGAAAPDYDHGRSVASAGDVNGDGFDDIIIGAPGNDEGGDAAGAAYVIFGKAGGFGTVQDGGRSVIDLATLTPTDGFIIRGDSASDSAGGSVSSAGDFNGDGFDDLIVGAPYGDDGGSEAGEAYVIFGGDFLGGVVFAGDAGDNAFTGTAAAESFIGARGEDTLIGKGGADVFHGGEGDDNIKVSTLDFFLVDGGTGKDTLELDGAGLNLDLTALANNRIQAIEQIDITGAGANTLTLSVLDVLDLSDSSNTLLVKGNGDDSAKIGAGWTAAASGGTNGDGTSTINGQVFQIYTAGQAMLLVDQDINTATV
jgi:hypothetical protein